jgi:diguanylate cyclase (GGDEF)-like protein
MWLVGLCVGVLAHAQPAAGTIQIAPAGLYTDVSAQAGFWFEPAGRASVEAVAETPHVFATTGTRSWPLQAGNALWARVVLPPMAGPDRWYLDNASPATDRTTVYVRSADGWQATEAGDKVAVSTWPSPERMPTFRLPVSATAPTEVLVRIENQFNTTPRLRLWRDGDLTQVREGEYLLLGGFFALALVIVLGCATQAVLYRDKVFAWFGGYALMLAGAQAALTGLLGQFILTDNPWLLDRSVYIAPMLATTLALWFIREVTDLRTSAAWLYQTAFWFGALGLGFLAWFLVTPEQSVFSLYNLYIVSAFVFVIGALALAARRGDPYALWFLLGFGVLMAGSGLVILRNLEILPAHFFVLNAPIISAAMALPICYWVAQTRARALFVAQARANALQSDDPLTGLANRSRFEQRLPNTLIRANSRAVNGALLLIEVANLSQLVKESGDEWRDKAMVVAAARLRDLARDVDLLARVGPAQFGLIMEGPVNRAEAADAAARAVARGLQQSSNLPHGQSLNLHVAVLMMPEHGSEPDELLRAGEQLLERIRRQPQRKVLFPDAPTTSGLPKAFDPKALDEMQREAEAALGPDHDGDDGMHRTRRADR